MAPGEEHGGAAGPGGGARRRLAVIGVRGIPDVIGGIETHCALLYPAVAELLPDFRITILARRPYVAAKRYVHEGVEVRALRAPRGAATETLFHSLWAVLYARVALRADIVHLHGIGPGFFTPLARLLGMRVVVTDHAADFLRPKWGRAGRAFLRAGEWLAARFADRLVCVSEAVRRDLLTRCSAQRSAVTIRHGVRLPESPPEADAEVLATRGLLPGRYLLAVGRLDETKRFEDLIEAHRAARPGVLPLVIAGCGIGNPDYERQLRAKAGPGVHFLGYCAGPLLTSLYRGAALLIHPSEMEGFGLVVLEALSVGAPVRLSDIAVHREFALQDDAYFAVGDRAAIRAHIEAAGPRSSPSPEAAAVAARHSHAASARAHAELFRQLLWPPRAAHEGSAAVRRLSNSDQ